MIEPFHFINFHYLNVASKVLLLRMTADFLQKVDIIPQGSCVFADCAARPQPCLNGSDRRWLQPNTEGVLGQPDNFDRLLKKVLDFG